MQTAAMTNPSPATVHRQPNQLYPKHRQGPGKAANGETHCLKG